MAADPQPDPRAGGKVGSFVMGTGLFAALVTGAALLLALASVLVAVVVSGRRSHQALISSRAEIETLHARVSALSEEVAAARVAAAAAPPRPDAERLITTAGGSTNAMSDRVVLSAAVGEPLVKLAAFGYGVRRALAPHTRNRIAFEMRREVKRARKQRKRELRQPYRPDAEAAA